MDLFGKYLFVTEERFQGWYTDARRQLLTWIYTHAICCFMAFCADFFGVFDAANFMRVGARVIIVYTIPIIMFAATMLWWVERIKKAREHNAEIEAVIRDRHGG